MAAHEPRAMAACEIDYVAGERTRVVAVVLDSRRRRCATTGHRFGRRPSVRLNSFTRPDQRRLLLLRAWWCSAVTRCDRWTQLTLDAHRERFARMGCLMRDTGERIGHGGEEREDMEGEDGTVIQATTVYISIQSNWPSEASAVDSLLMPPIHSGDIGRE